MTNLDAMKLLSPRTRLLLREHAKIVGVDVAKLASELVEVMAQDMEARPSSRGLASSLSRGRNTFLRRNRTILAAVMSNH
jgi:hypothetical protein